MNEKETKPFFTQVFSRDFTVGLTQFAVVLTTLYSIGALARAVSR